MKYKADAVVYSPDGELQLVAEVKRISSTSIAWAVQMRRNLLANRLLPTSPFFMLVCLDRLYLWKDTVAPYDIPPQYEADSQYILQPYFKTPSLWRRRASEYSIVIAVSSWLNNVISSRPPSKMQKDLVPLLYESGLYDSIWGGSVSTEAEL